MMLKIMEAFIFSLSVCPSLCTPPPDAFPAQIWLSGPLRGGSPVEHRGTFVRPFIRLSIRPPLIGPQIWPRLPKIWPL